MNAILQSLFSLPSFSNDLLKQSTFWKNLPINALLRYSSQYSYKCIMIEFLVLFHSEGSWLSWISTPCRRFAHLMIKKDVGCPETKKDLLRKVKNAISSTAERFSGNMQNVRFFSWNSNHLPTLFKKKRGFNSLEQNHVTAVIVFCFFANI